ncbi:MAG: phosphatase domain-containing protein [Bacteroidota bacterium]
MITRIISFPFRYAFARLKKSIGALDTVKVEALYAFGNENKILFKGRVVESYKQSRPSANKTYFQNILAALRRYAGSSAPDVKVDVSFRNKTKSLVSDAEGIISCSFDYKMNNEKNEKITFRLRAENGIKPEKKEDTIDVFIYKSNHPMGVISDIDDTVLISHATRAGKKFWLSISKNAYTRRPFPGVSRFYKSLSDNGKNPLFYVSSSDWNLFDMIKDFLNYREIPSGTLLLKDLHVNLRNIWKSGGGNHQHKLEKIELLMELYPGMNFVLIGDSGQHDPELYAEIMKDYPGRIIAVYIREVKPVNQIRKKLLKAKIEDPKSPNILFVKQTKQAIEHAQNHNIITKTSIKKHLYVVNPKSGSGNEHNQALQSLKDIFGSDFIDIYETTGKDDISIIKNKLKNDEPDTLIIGGGDGTVRMAAEAVENQDTPIGIIPLGSANGLAKCLDIDSIDEALKALKAKKTINIDVLKINNEICLHLSDFGFNAGLIKIFEEDKSDRGMFAYFKSSLKQIQKLETYQFKIKINNKEEKIKAKMLIVANGDRYGTGAIINPAGKIDDGIMEIIALNPNSIEDFVELSASLLNGNINESANVRIWSGKKADIINSDKAEFQIDGEVKGKMKKIHIICEANKLKFFTLK